MSDMEWRVLTEQLDEAIQLLNEVTEMWPALELHGPHEDQKNLGDRIQKYLERIQ